MVRYARAETREYENRGRRPLTEWSVRSGTMLQFLRYVDLNDAPKLRTANQVEGGQIPGFSNSMPAEL